MVSAVRSSADETCRTRVSSVVETLECPARREMTCTGIPTFHAVPDSKGNGGDEPDVRGEPTR